MAESKEELKNILLRVKTGLKLSIKKPRSWHLVLSLHDRSGNSDDFLFLGSKISVDGDCSHKIRRRLLLGRKAMTNLDSVLKTKDITLPTKVRIVKAMVFSSSRVQM